MSGSAAQPHSFKELWYSGHWWDGCCQFMYTACVCQKDLWQTCWKTKTTRYTGAGCLGRKANGNVAPQRWCRGLLYSNTFWAELASSPRSGAIIHWSLKKGLAQLWNALQSLAQSTLLIHLHQCTTEMRRHSGLHHKGISITAYLVTTYSAASKDWGANRYRGKIRNLFYSFLVIEDPNESVAGWHLLFIFGATLGPKRCSGGPGSLWVLVHWGSWGQLL